MKNQCILLLMSLKTLAAVAACPSWPTAERFVINGSEVTDTRTGLIWSRCSVGQTLSGNICAGTATTQTHEPALQVGAFNSGWRLPNRRELFSLADKGCNNPAIDGTAFPNTLSYWYWTSSPYQGSGAGAWVIDFDRGLVEGSYRYGEGRAVRLVRAIR